jgi:transcriptional regulator with XRE-family HTH domain
MRMPRSRVVNMDAMRFGAIVRRLREGRGWTRRKLATRAGLSPQYVGVLEEGGNIPTLAVVLELTEVLGADVAEIMRELSIARNTPAAR